MACERITEVRAKQTCRSHISINMLMKKGLENNLSQIRGLWYHLARFESQHHSAPLSLSRPPLVVSLRVNLVISSWTTAVGFETPYSESTFVALPSVDIWWAYVVTRDLSRLAQLRFVVRLRCSGAIPRPTRKEINVGAIPCAYKIFSDTVHEADLSAHSHKSGQPLR